jgi:hypothetical protein
VSLKERIARAEKQLDPQDELLTILVRGGSGRALQACGDKLDLRPAENESEEAFIKRSQVAAVEARESNIVIFGLKPSLNPLQFKEHI